MNIFVLHSDPKLAAEYQCDKHIVKMTVETAQMLSGPLSKIGIPGVYKATHWNHPCSVWARTSLENYQWLLQHGFSLAIEYTYRYDKVHKSIYTIMECNKQYHLLNLPSMGLTEFAQALPEECKNVDPVEAYRLFYRLHKKKFATWKRRDVPEWFL